MCLQREMWGFQWGGFCWQGWKHTGASLSMVIIRTRSPAFPECARPLRGTEESLDTPARRDAVRDYAAQSLHHEAFIWEGTQSPPCKLGADESAVFPDFQMQRQVPLHYSPLLNQPSASREVLT